MAVFHRCKQYLLIIALAGALAACDDGSDGTDAPTPNQNFSLQLLHFADVDGAGGADDVRGFSQLVNAFRSGRADNTLLVSSGDNYIPGAEFNAAAEDELENVLGVPGVGRANVAWLNALGVQASAVGNHELDQGTRAFTGIIGRDGGYPGAQFPYLSTNLDFGSDSSTAPLVVEDGQPVQSNALAGSATVQIDGRTIGLVGATTPALASITSTGGIGISPASSNDNQALAATIQPAVDALTASGVDIIVLLAHMQQIAIEQELATLLSDVDIIVAGGSNTVLADLNDSLRPGDTAADTYPLEFQSATGDPVLVVNTAGDFQYLGRLVVEFDDNGLLLSDSVDPVISGAYRSDREPLEPFGPIGPVVAVADALQAVLRRLDGNVLGLTDVFLDGRRTNVRTQETNLGNLTAEANLFIAQQADPTVIASFKNGGGIRDAIGRAEIPAGSTDPADMVFLPPAANPSVGKPAGGISQLDIQGALAFDNGLSLITLTAAELADVIEHAVAGSAPGAAPGQFAQVGGLRFSFDATRTARDAGDTNQADVNISGDRLRSLAVIDDSGAVIDQVVENGIVIGNPSRSFRVVTLSFLVSCIPNGGNCGDGYPLNGLTAPNRVDIADLGTDPGLSDFSPVGGEQDALGEFLAGFFPVGGTPFNQAETPPAQDQRIQNLAARDDTVIALEQRGGSLQQIGRFFSGAGFDEGGAEIVAFDPGTNRLFVINSDAGTIDVLDVSNPAAPSRIMQLDPVGDDSTGGVTLDGVNSIAVGNNLVAAALEADPATDNGRVGFYDATTLAYLGSIEAGALPDAVTFSPDGNTVLVANEGEVPDDPNDDDLRDFSADVPGSITLINVANGVNNAVAINLGFADFNAGGPRNGELPAGVRIDPQATSVANDLEPELITVSPDGNLAFVTLQENAAVAVISGIGGATPVIREIVALGTRDHGLAGNGLDVSNDDGGIRIEPRPGVEGLIMPDGLDNYTVAGNTFFITADEGDSRDDVDECDIDDPRIGPLDPAVFPEGIGFLGQNSELGDLTYSCFGSDTDGNGSADRLLAFGARGFTIFSAAAGSGEVANSGDDFERVTAHLDKFGDRLLIFNDDNDDDSPDRDGRSNDSGPEPEGVVTGVIGERQFAFIGLERVGGIMMYDVTNPRVPRFISYINNRDFSVSGADLESGAAPLDSAGDIGPEGLVFIPAADSPNGADLLVVGNEVTGTTTIYQVNVD